jgi:hypothetical protein
MTNVKPTNDRVIDAMTGAHMPIKGVTRSILLPADHKQIARGELVIVETKPTKASKGTEE